MMKTKSTIKTFAILLLMAVGGVSQAWSDTRTWDFSDGTLWTTNLSTGYYTPTGGSTPLISDPADLSTAIYVKTTNGLEKQDEGSYKGFFSGSNNSNSKPSDEYISIEIPVGYTLSATGQTTNGNYNNTFTFAVWSGDTRLYCVTSTTDKTTREYKNEGEVSVVAYIYNNSTNDSRKLRVFDITLSNEKVKHSYTVNYIDKDENVLKAAALSGDVNEGEEFSYSLAKAFLADDGDYYVLKDSESKTDFSVTKTMGTSNIVDNYEYTKDENIYYYQELGGSAADAIYSSGNVLSAETPFSKTIDASGQYELSFNQYERGTRTTELYVGDVMIESYGDDGIFSKSLNIVSSSTVKLTGNGNGTNNSNYVDYVLIRRIGDAVTTKSATITSAGWATLYTPYALNFDGTGLTAYTATCTSSTVTLTPVTNVPANTGVVLKGAAKDYDIPVINSSSTDKGHMVGSTTAATAYNAFDGYDLYMLVKNASNEAQFKKVTSGSIAAGKAFLKINNSGASALSPVMNVVFADGTTGVNDVRRKKEEVRSEFYNLNGQRVANPQKGLYIVNGKKVIIK
jgi:hypothetical protein